MVSFWNNHRGELENEREGVEGEDSRKRAIAP
jgi:hypothetical protein